MTAEPQPHDTEPNPGTTAAEIRGQRRQSIGCPASQLRCLPLLSHCEPTWTASSCGQNAVWFCKLRWIVVGFLLAAAAAAPFPSLLSVIGIRLDYGWPLVTAVALGLLNAVYLLLIPSEHARLAQVRWHLWVQIVANLGLRITVADNYLGSVETAAPFMYLFHIVLSCVFFPPPESLAVAAIAMVLYCGCLLLEAAGSPTVTVVLDAHIVDRDFLSLRFWTLHLRRSWESGESSGIWHRGCRPRFGSGKRNWRSATCG